MRETDIVKAHDFFRTHQVVKGFQGIFGKKIKS